MELLEQGEASLVSVDLACSSELEHNLYRNCRLALSIMLQRSWALGKERLLSHWSRRRAWHAGSRHVSVLMSQLTGDNHVLQSRVVQSQGLLGESPGRQSVLQSCSCGSLVEKQSVASYLGLLLISFSPSSWAGWHQGERADCPTATMKIAPRKEQLGSSCLGFVILATFTSREWGKGMNELFHLHKFIPSGGIQA